MRTSIDRTGEPFTFTPDETKQDADGLTWHRLTFDSLDACLELAMRPMSPKNADLPEELETVEHVSYLTGNGKQRGTWTPAEWLGVPSGTHTEVVQALHEGFKPGADMVEEIGQRLPADLRPPMAQRRRPAWGDAGDSVDMQRVWGGSLDRAWRRTRPAPVRATRTVRLAVMLNTRANVSSATTAWRGVAALALAHLLTARGYAVEIVGVMSSADVYGPAPEGAGDCLYTEVMLKHTHKPLDVMTLSGPMVVLGFFRYVGFAIRGHGAKQLRDYKGSSVPPESTPFWRPGYVGGFEACCDATSAEQFIRAALRRIEAGEELAA